MPTDSCLIPYEQSIDTVDSLPFDAFGRYVMIRTTLGNPQLVGDPLLCLSCIRDDTIQAGDIAVPSWGLELLSVPTCSKVYVTPVLLEFLASTDIFRIVLVYRGRKMYRHWDEIATECAFSVPGAWCSDWPSGVPKRAVEKFLPVLLQSRTLIDGSSFVLDVLDNTMVRSSVIFYACSVITVLVIARSNCCIFYRFYFLYFSFWYWTDYLHDNL